MAGESIYDVEYSQETGMPSDVMNENDYTQDVFFQTRPEVFDFDHRDRGEPDEGDPYFRDWDMDEQVKIISAGLSLRASQCHLTCHKSLQTASAGACSQRQGLPSRLVPLRPLPCERPSL